MLIYTSDQMPGISRKGAGKGFFYLDSNGAKINDSTIIRRIQSLAIPPAYSDVWVCEFENGHLQATGRDQRNRKQYRYHPDWQEIRNLDKFDKLIEIGTGLPKLRRRLRKDLKNFSGTKDEVVASAVRIIDRLGLRVGNQRYLKENKTRGVSTLSTDNVEFSSGSTIKIQYTAKGGRAVQTHLNDSLLADALEACHELGGQGLFSYQDTPGNIHSIDSADINRYLSDTYESNISAKDLRTWRASSEAVNYLRKIKQPKDREAEIREAIRHAAKEIKNRYATCRKHYVHPVILSTYENSSKAGFSRLKTESQSELQLAEALLLRLLQT
ncbi:MAG TPA: DNA topoisomerase [Opitutae bacterium]|nr:DNA topoisomerase [Opitutae bacterium]